MIGQDHSDCQIWQAPSWKEGATPHLYWSRYSGPPDDVVGCVLVQYLALPQSSDAFLTNTTQHVVEGVEGATDTNPLLPYSAPAGQAIVNLAHVDWASSVLGSSTFTAAHRSPATATDLFEYGISE
ncbi:hypothetical protein CKAH01_09559 [Colletotrichum kahawae]|uniref:Uncharacterized protein n=1 Tax=Colletotrichum kahawae TaxID=34407 RepID=A0AAD9Y0L6_COLKA|nr:hypothetical protein CKAH01_09559 [Colletotrichum kahawae]